MKCSLFDDDIINVRDALADAGKRVIAAGLDQDFRGAFWSNAQADGARRKR